MTVLLLTKVVEVWIGRGALVSPRHDRGAWCRLIVPYEGIAYRTMEDRHGDVYSFMVAGQAYRVAAGDCERVTVGMARKQRKVD